MVALLTVHSLRIAEHLRTRFSRITIPQHVFDEIQNDRLSNEDRSCPLWPGGKGRGGAVHANRDDGGCLVGESGIRALCAGVGRYL